MRIICIFGVQGFINSSFSCQWGRNLQPFEQCIKNGNTGTVSVATLMKDKITTIKIPAAVEEL